MSGSLLRSTGDTWRFWTIVAIDYTWNSVEGGLPPPEQVVEVWIKLARSAGTTWLRGYLARDRAPGTEPYWLNALTDEPFPSGWSVTKWRHVAPDQASDPSAGPLRESA